MAAADVMLGVAMAGGYALLMLLRRRAVARDRAAGPVGADTVPGRHGTPAPRRLRPGALLTRGVSRPVRVLRTELHRQAERVLRTELHRRAERVLRPRRPRRRPPVRPANRNALA